MYCVKPVGAGKPAFSEDYGIDFLLFTVVHFLQRPFLDAL